MTQQMCDEVVRIEPRSLAWVPNHYKAQTMCKEAVRRDSCTLGNVAVIVEVTDSYFKNYLIR